MTFDAGAGQLPAFSGRPILLFASTIGSHSLATLLSAYGVKTLVGFMDNNVALHGIDASGLPVYPPAEAATKHPDALVVLCVHWGAMDAVRIQCQELGLECITPEECWRHLLARVQSR
jgi:hypothetical protein